MNIAKHCSTCQVVCPRFLISSGLYHRLQDQELTVQRLNSAYITCWSIYPGIPYWSLSPMLHIMYSVFHKKTNVGHVYVQIDYLSHWLGSSIIKRQGWSTTSFCIPAAFRMFAYSVFPILTRFYTLRWPFLLLNCIIMAKGYLSQYQNTWVQACQILTNNSWPYHDTINLQQGASSWHCHSWWGEILPSRCQYNKATRFLGWPQSCREPEFIFPTWLSKGIQPRYTYSVL